jgi:predicted metal-dependent phosphoesterase TrpH
MVCSVLETGDRLLGILLRQLKKYETGGRALKIDLHVHSKYSHDSNSNVEDIINAAIKSGIQGVSITDHNSFEGSKEALEICPPGFTIIPGAEYSTRQGHLLVYFIRDGLETILKKDEFGVYRWQEIIDAAKEQQALVFLAHPYRFHKQLDEELLERVDGIEIYNCRAALCRQINANQMAVKEAKRLNKAFSAGSDGHWLGEVGKAFWELSNKIYMDSEDSIKLTRENIKNALKNGEGRVYGSATTRLYEPASQILGRVKANKLNRLPKPVAKMGYACIMECARFLGIGKRPLEGWFDLN